MFAYCCGHATIVAQRQPIFGATGATTPHGGPTSLSRWRGGLLAGHTAAGTADDGIVSNGNRPARRRANIATTDRASRRDLAPSVRSHRYDGGLRHYVVRPPQCAKWIASFLCSRHFLRQFLSRNDAATTCMPIADSSFIQVPNDIPDCLQQMLLAAA